MRQIIFTLLITLFAVICVNAQTEKDEILLTIGGNDITRGEFERIYTKNNQEPAFDEASLDEYMELFINFKLKVYEAELLGMDTLKSFISELKGYRNQLEKPFFTDENADEKLILEAYERMQWDVRASHILIKCDEKALPADTLKAYKRIAKIRKQALSGENFGKLAKENSEDPSVQRNNGDLGYFTAFSMVYPFETAAYTTEAGEISEIIRTRFGYHILKIIDKKENKGEIKVAHLMRAIPQGSDAKKEALEKKRIYQIYDSIVAGADFTLMVKNHSDDRGTSQRGGELPFFGTGKMIPDFEKVAFGLKEIGEYSKPVKTPYGWHIIKLLDVKPLGTFEELKPTIKNKISKDIRAQRGRQLVISRLKEEYNVKINKKALKPFYTLVDSTIMEGHWNPAPTENMQDVLLTIADTVKYTQHDFAHHIGNDDLRRIPKPIVLIVDEEFDRYVEKKIIAFEKSRLEDKYPDFKHLVKEYHDGILLFNLTDKMVWSKAVEDTSGLEKFYSEHKNDYMWGDRVEATMYTYNNADFTKSITKLAKKVAKKDLDVTVERAKFVNAALTKDSTFTLNITKLKYSKGDNEFVDAVSKETGLKAVQEAGGKYILIFVNNLLGPEPKELNEAKGLITADYQNYLEKEWLKELREKYKIEIHEEVFKKMIK